jgi:hypothetical protein
MRSNDLVPLYQYPLTLISGYVQIGVCHCPPILIFVYAQVSVCHPIAVVAISTCLNVKQHLNDFGLVHHNHARDAVIDSVENNHLGRVVSIFHHASHKMNSWTVERPTHELKGHSVHYCIKIVAVLLSAAWNLALHQHHHHQLHQLPPTLSSIGIIKQLRKQPLMPMMHAPYCCLTACATFAKKS